MILMPMSIVAIWYRPRIGYRLAAVTTAVAPPSPRVADGPGSHSSLLRPSHNSPEVLTFAEGVERWVEKCLVGPPEPLVEAILQDSHRSVVMFGLGVAQGRPKSILPAFSGSFSRLKRASWIAS